MSAASWDGCMTYKGARESLRRNKIKDGLLNFHDNFFVKKKKYRIDSALGKDAADVKQATQ